MDWNFLARKRGRRRAGGYQNSWIAQVSDGSPSSGGVGNSQRQRLELWITAVFTV